VGVPNAGQIADWNGAVGQRWAAEQAVLDDLIRPYGAAVLAAASPTHGEKILDIGCGCGDTSIALAHAVGPTGAVVGVDVSAPMLDVARRRSVGLDNLHFMEADASNADLPTGQSLLFSRFGVMFFDDPVAAFAHMGASLVPGGRLAFVCWQSGSVNPWATAPAKAALEASGLSFPPADPSAPGPFAFADPERVRSILSDAGFRDVETRPQEADMHLGATAADAAVSSLKVGPASRIAREAGPEAFAGLLRAVEDALRPHAAASGAVILRGRAWLVTARWP